MREALIFICSGALGRSHRGMAGGAGGGATVLSAGTGTAIGAASGMGSGLSVDTAKSVVTQLVIRTANYTLTMTPA